MKLMYVTSWIVRATTFIYLVRYISLVGDISIWMIQPLMSLECKQLENSLDIYLLLEKDI